MERRMNRYLSLRFGRTLAAAEASSLAAEARDAGWGLQLCSDAQFARSYALLHAVRDTASLEFAERYAGVVRYEEPMLALTIEPEAQAALPSLAAALGGPGAPEGILTAEIRGAQLLVEFVPARTSWRLVRAVIDVELERFGSRVRSTKLLSTLTPEMEVQIAADGLQEPELTESRVLEALIADADH
jgi:hypothetical protein